jgi:hypothetical protein
VARELIADDPDIEAFLNGEDIPSRLRAPTSSCWPVSATKPQTDAVPMKIDTPPILD